MRFPFTQLMSTNGDGSGTVNQAGNYAAAAQLFSVTCPVGYRMYISHVHIVVVDNAALNIIDYGAITNGITNGLAVNLKLNGVVHDSLEGFRIKQNMDFYAFTDVTITDFPGSGQALVGIVEFNNFYASELVLNAGDYFGIVVHDDISSLLKQYGAVWGQLEAL